MTAHTPKSSCRLAVHWLLAASLQSTALAQVTNGQGDAANVEFNPYFMMRPDGSRVDVSRFSSGNPVTPGRHPVDIYVNGAWVGRDIVRFDASNGVVGPCMDRKLLGRLGLDDPAPVTADQGTPAPAPDDACRPPSAISEDVTWSFDLNDLRLDFSVAQALLKHPPRGSVSPDLWDEGVPSAIVSYNLNSFHTTGLGTNTFLGLDSGLNLGSWHLRQRSSMTWQTGGATGSRYDYQNIATYLQHDIAKLRSQLTIGDAYTDGAVFDSFSVRGVNLGSDDRMLPDSARGYAPMVRGVARSNARVTVTQNGSKLYETTVAPGPFEINDLYATGYGGNLVVTITEADGSQSSFTVPYASVVQLLRPGITRYSATVGEYRDTSLKTSSRDKLVQATVQHGFSNLVTGYAGLVLAEGYQAGLIGGAFNLPVGALALDVTQAQTQIPNISHTSGQSMRLSYSKFVPATSTNMSIAAYRYASSGFWSMRDAMTARANGGAAANVDRPRNQFQLSVNQRLGDRWGNVYFTGSSIEYWNHSNTALTFQVGYSNSMRLLGTSVSYNLSASRLRDVTTGNYTTQVFASLIVPLGSGSQAPMFSVGATHDSAIGSSQQVRLNGSALEDSALTYGLSADHNPSTTTGGGTVQYRSPYTTVSASASGGSQYTQYSAGLQGAVVGHAGGITLANYLGDTIGIVEAKGATGARITNSPGVKIDPFGYAIVPFLQPYNMNTVDLNPKDIPFDVSLDATSVKVAPRANAAVKVRFVALAGRSAIIVARQPDGKSLQFGARVSDGNDTEVGAVGQGGTIFARGIADSGRLQVIWGPGDDQRCALQYQLPPRNERPTFYTRVESVCEPSTRETP